jgi:Protein of unknown function (DUF1552)
MSLKKSGISRREALMGLGTLVALPWMESLASAAPAVVAPPKRAAFLYVPNGVNVENWFPSAVGKLTGELPKTLSTLKPFIGQMNVLTGLTLDKARANGDGGGDHARAMSSFLTGRQARKTHGADIRIGKSADQHLADAIGDATRFASLELGIERGAQAGNCDSGYSCAYSSNLSWRGEATPNAKEVDPKLVFERLFGSNDPKDTQVARAKREAYNKSVLDFVSEDAKSLTKTLGNNDQRKLDEYLSAVREVENRIEKAKKASLDRKPVAKPNMASPTGIPKEMQDHVRLMCDLMVLSFQTDLTRIITMPFANDGSNRAYPHIGVPEGHHDLSHHGKDAKKLEKLQKINAFHIEQLAYLLEKLQGVKEANGTTLLDNLMLVYGSGISDGDRHNHDELPILLFGKGGGDLETGRHLKFAKETPLMNLYLTMFDRLGAPATAFGDSTGKLKL